jgi:hypothetical protein
MALETANPALSASRNFDRPVISGQVLRPAQPGIKLTVRGRRLVALLALLPIVAAFLLIGTRSAQAETAMPATAIIKIEAGQTLWDVAVAIAPNEDPRATIWTIKALNGLVTSEVQAGQALVVPAN